MKQSERDRWNAKGFKDALVHGKHDPYVKSGGDSAIVEYERGFEDGMRAVERIRQRPDDRPQPYESELVG